MLLHFLLHLLILEPQTFPKVVEFCLGLCVLVAEAILQVVSHEEVVENLP